MRRRLRKFGRVLLWLLAGLMVLLSLPFVVAFHASGRDFLREQALELSQGALPYQVKVARLDRFDPSGIELKDVELRDQRGRLLVQLAAVELHLAPGELALGRLHVTSLHVRDGKVDVSALTEPSPEEEAKKPEEKPKDQQKSSFQIQADDVDLSRIALSMKLSNRPLFAAVERLRAVLSYGPNTSLTLLALDGAVADQRGRFANFSTETTNFDPAHGGQAVISGNVLDTSIRLAAAVGEIHSDGTWPVGHAELSVHNLHSATLTRLGVSGLTLQRRLDLELRAASVENKGHVGLEISDRQRTLLSLFAQGNTSNVAADLMLASVKLDSIASELPAHRVAGNVHATYQVANGASPWTLSWSHVMFDGSPGPAGELTGSLKDTLVRLEQTRIAGLEKTLRASASYNSNGSKLSADVRLAPVQLEQVSWLRRRGYRGHAELELSFAGPLDGDVHANLRALLSDAVLGKTTRLNHVRAQLAVRGKLERPQGTGRVELENLQAGQVTVQKGTIDLKAQGKAIAATFRVLADRARLQGRAELQQEEASRAGRLYVFGSLRDRPLTMTATVAQKGSGATDANLNLSVAQQQLTARLARSAQERIIANVQARAIDLSFWGKLVGQSDLAGQIDLQAQARGAEQRPVVDVKLSARDVRGMQQPATDLDLTAHADLGARSYALTLDARGKSDDLSAHVAGSAKLPAHAKNLETWLRGPYALEAHVKVPARRLGALDEQRLGGLRGAIALNVDAHGRGKDLAWNADVDAELRLPTADDDRSDRLQVKLALNREKGGLTVFAHDREGPLLNAKTSVQWPGGSIFSAMRGQAWQSLPTFEVHAQLSDRRLDRMQGVYAYFAGIYDFDMPVRVGAQVDVTGAADDLSGSVHSRTVVMSDALDPTCALGAQVQAGLDVKIDRGVVDATVDVGTNAGGHLSVAAHEELHVKPSAPLSTWLGPASVEAKAQGVELRTLPGLCQLASGRAALALHATALGGKPAQADVSVQLAGVTGQVGQPEPLGMNVTAALRPDSFNLQGELSSQQHPAGNFSVQLPMVAPRTALVPTPKPNAPVKAHLALTHLPVAPFLGLGDVLGHPSGALSAELDLNSPIEQPHPRGFVELEKISFSLASTAQPLRRMTGRIEIDDHMLTVKDLTAHDQGGSVRINGQAHINDNGTGEARISLRADALPLRRQGDVVGKLDLEARVDARVPQNHLAEIGVKLEGGRIWLTGEKGRAVQSLDADPDVVFIDVPHKQQVEEEKKNETQPKMGFAWMKIQSDKDLWLEHEDFAVQLGVDMKFVQEDQATLRGDVTLRRGEVQLLGKNFKIQRGGVHFTGDAPPDPDLDIKLVYRTPDGQDLNVAVTGRATTPQLVFSGAATNAGEAVAVLSGVGRTGADAKATDDARNFATNLTAGLLTMAARREFGEWVPVLGVESDASGAVSGARAGFDASKLIPKALRNFARAAYVEGIVGSTANSENGGGKFGVGVHVEIVLPADIITSWGYGPGATWATDVSWMP